MGQEHPTTSSGLQSYEWRLDYAPYTSGVEFKFVCILPSATEAWMDGNNLSLQPDVGQIYTYTHPTVRFCFLVSFSTTQYAASEVTLRDQRHGWADLNGHYNQSEGRWDFVLDWADYFDPSMYGEIRMVFKFVLDRHRWMTGPNLQIEPGSMPIGTPGVSHVGPQIGRNYDYNEAQVQFLPS